MKKLLLLSFILIGINANAQFPLPYCANTFTTAVEPITLVNFADINNTSPNTVGSVAHQDFTAIVGNVVAGNTYTITVNGNSDGNYNNNYSLFVDWNNDNDFDDSDERYNIGSIVNSTGLSAASQISTSVLIPGNALAGNHRMRVVKEYNSSNTTFPLPCRTGVGYGQSEDYTLLVTVPNCISPSGGSAVVDLSFLSANLSWTAGGPNSEIIIQVEGDGFPSDAPNFGDNVATNSYTVTDLFADTSYEFYVRTECEDGIGYSTWAGPFLFNTFSPATCTTVNYPADGATNIPAGTSTTPVPLTFSWNAVPGATSYSLYYGTSATGSATIFLANYTTTTATINITGYNALFYWKIVPIGPGGAAVGCVDWTFTTIQDPALSNENFINNQFSVYPNPANNFVNIAANGLNMNSIELSDLNGRVVKNISVNGNEAQVNISDLSQGVYMMKITSDEGVATKKIVKE